MVAVDEAFKGAGQKVGIEIWRIKQFKVIPLKKEEYGIFYSGDSYIILNTKGQKTWDVHFWLGKDTTQDEMGTAAIKTVELDDALGGLPVQYRELQNHESAKFSSYFPLGITYLDGGFETGFKSIADLKVAPRLLHCKGKRVVRAKEVPLKVESLNKGDPFVLDAGEKIMLWIPPESGRMERIKGIQLANNIRDGRHAGRGDVIILDDNWDSSPMFWDYFGGTDALNKVKSSQEGGKDEGHWIEKKQTVKLFKVSDASGKMVIEKVAQGDIDFDALESKDAFILDAGAGGVFVWVGRKCTMDERKRAMEYATEYIKQSGLPKDTQVMRVLETAEPNIFVQWFTKKPAKKEAFKPRLYHVSDASGKLVIEEVAKYDQDSLYVDDVMILDTGDNVFVWIGSKANAKEKQQGKETAKKFITLSGIPRPLGAKVLALEQNKETDDFKKHFPKWGGSVTETTISSVKKNVLRATDMYF